MCMSDAGRSQKLGCWMCGALNWSYVHVCWEANPGPWCLPALSTLTPFFKNDYLNWPFPACMSVWELNLLIFYLCSMWNWVIVVSCHVEAGNQTCPLGFTHRVIPAVWLLSWHGFLLPFTLACFSLLYFIWVSMLFTGASYIFSILHFISIHING